jgi:hypothetical protein
VHTTLRWPFLAHFVACADASLSVVDSPPQPPSYEAPSDGPEIQPVTGPTSKAIGSSSGAFLWQGMDHRWLRTVVGFETPHRLSYFESLISKEGINGAHVPSAMFSFGAGTGVDGDYMDPVGRWGALQSPDVLTVRGSHEFVGTDSISVGQYPKATTDISKTIELSLPEGFKTDSTVVAGVLQGFTMSLHCDPKKQSADNPCNSDGAWPVSFGFGVDSCKVQERHVTCEVAFHLQRAWTPAKGGIPGIEEKPLNAKLDYSFRVNFVAVVGKTGVFAATQDRVAQRGSIHDGAAKIAKRSILVPRSMNSVVAGFSSVGFELYKTLATDDANHLGRYIGDINFGLRKSSYDPNLAKFSYETEMQVWAPTTVQDSGVRYTAKTQVLQFASATVSTGSARGAICVNSSDQAPALTAWKQCGGNSLVSEQARDEERIYAK